ncbi:uncharacterized protein LOC107416522 [Ziziphus jujuba]|uniref:RING-type E3 ubiquitin transferase n=2 Tax=Ziziphus jujuba TaxID=326968 RepID=A0A6P3ZNG5_ZIZJJ|nr:uncharacterized protein LOC107416522 [Ziziphus jujuba]KAH7532814.1 hypothetical protein FEM48_Zijuj04G0062300 [Ziziphus jujuba var. spinosa]
MGEISSSDHHPQALDPLPHWSWHPDCNPFAYSTSFVRSPISLVDAVGPGSSDSDWFSDTDSSSDRDVSCLVTDLFDRSGESDQTTTTQQWDDDSDDCGGGSASYDWGIGGFEDAREIGLVFGLDSQSNGSVHEIGENSGSDFCSNGLRIVGLDSDSDSDDGVVEVLGVDSGNYSVVNDSNRHLRWDSVCFEEQRSIYEDFDWEEVEGRNNDTENLGTVFDDEVEEQLSVASGYSTIVEEPLEEAARNLEWQILLAVNNLALNTSLERERSGGGDVDVDSYLAVQDEMYTVEYDTLFGQFIESENALKGSPPAAKSVVENLPFVKLTMEELQKDDVVCAICKEKILLEEKVKKLPCCHYYHGECIEPWLGIRNSCPVCRYELPTDDPDYERRKSQTASHGMSRNSQSQVRLNFEMFA